MGGDRHRPQRRAGKHHSNIFRSHPAALGDEFGLAGMREADGVELLLADRAGDDRGRRRRAGEADCQL